MLGLVSARLGICEHRVGSLTTERNRVGSPIDAGTVPHVGVTSTLAFSDGELVHQKAIARPLPTPVLVAALTFMSSSRFAALSAGALILGMLSGCASGAPVLDCEGVHDTTREFAMQAAMASGEPGSFDGLEVYVERLEAFGAKDLAAATGVYVSTIQGAAAGGGDDVDDASMTWGDAVAVTLRACGLGGY